jgi:tight adherence protein B
VRWAGAGLLTALAVFFLWAARSARSRSRTRDNIQKHLDPQSASDTRSQRSALSRSLTGLVERTALTKRVREACEGSNLNQHVLLRLWLASVLIVPAACFMLTRSLWVVPGALAAVLCAPRLVAQLAGMKRERLYREQLDDLASDLSLFLRSGTPVEEALALCSRDSSPGIRAAVVRFQSDLSIGVSTDAALSSLVTELDNSDLRLIAQTMMTSHETGSDVTAIMDTIGEAVRERSAIARELESQTVQARLSGKVVAALPLVFLALSALASRGTLKILFGTVPGLLMLGAAAAMNVLGFLWIRRILDIE